MLRFYQAWKEKAHRPVAVSVASFSVSDLEGKLYLDTGQTGIRPFPPVGIYRLVPCALLNLGQTRTLIFPQEKVPKSYLKIEFKIMLKRRFF
jgi:hypothetical protein